MPFRTCAFFHHAFGPSHEMTKDLSQEDKVAAISKGSQVQRGTIASKWATQAGRGPRRPNYLGLRRIEAHRCEREHVAPCFWRPQRSGCVCSREGAAQESSTTSPNTAMQRKPTAMAGSSFCARWYPSETNSPSCSFSPDIFR